MTTYHFGTQVDPSNFTEMEDPDKPGQVIRPPAGKTLLVQNAVTLALLDPITTDDLGYWEYATEDVPVINVSGDGGTSWVGPLEGAESKLAGATAAVDASTALAQSSSAVATSSAALTTANEAKAIALAGSGGGGGFTGTVDWTTQVTGKPTIPATADDVGAIPTSAKGATNGVASLDATAKVPIGQIPVGTTSTDVAAGSHTHSQSWATVPSGTWGFVDWNGSSWPTRPTTRSDVRFVWCAPVGTAAPPAGAGYALSKDRFELEPVP